MPTTFLSFTAFVLLALSGCQSKSNEATAPGEGYFAEFYVRYLADQQLLNSQSSYYKGGTWTDAKAQQMPGGVAFLGSATEERSIGENIIRYESQQKTAHIPDLRFSYRYRADQEPLESIFHFPAIDSLVVLEASQKQGIRLKLAGELLDGEALRLLFIPDDGGETRTIVRLGPLTAPTLLLAPDATAELRPGNYLLSAVKTNTGEITSNGVNIRFNLEYYLADQAVTVRE